MANKQTENIVDYIKELRDLDTQYLSDPLMVVHQVNTMGDNEVGKMSLWDCICKWEDAGYMPSNGSIENLKYYINNHCPQWNIEKADETTEKSLGRIHADVIKSYLNLGMGVYMPNGVSFNRDDLSQESSFVGWGTIDTASCGDTANSTIDGNVCKGTFGMDTVYIKDLYVGNLHTDGSSSSGGNSSSTMDEATISTLTSNTIFVKEIRTNEGNNIIKIRSGVTFSGDINYSSIKYQKVNFYYLGYDGLRELEANYCCGIFAFRDDVFTGGNLYAHDINLMQSDASTFSLQEKIKSLEARIAALEAK